MYKRILLKLSGESLKGNQGSVVDPATCGWIAEAICEIYHLKVQIGIVVGGGNIFRGNLAADFGFARTPADHVGMLSTAINGLILAQVLRTKGCKVCVMSALNLGGIVELYHWDRARHILDQGRIVLFVGGTGNPYFTTDTTAAMRASEMDAEVLLKATKVNGIYDKDPMKHGDAVKYDRLTFHEVLTKRLNVMDPAAVVLCCENHIPIYVFNPFVAGALQASVRRKGGGTEVVRENDE